MLAGALGFRKGELAILVLVLTWGGILRFTHLDWGIHPDEVITVEVTDWMIKQHSWDTNWIYASVPSEFKFDQYNFSSYLMASRLTYPTAARLATATGLVAGDSPNAPLLTHRMSSAFFGVLACLLWYAVAAMVVRRPFALVTAAVVSSMLLLVQDSHYARPEVFMTFLVGLMLLLLLRAIKNGGAWAQITAGIVFGLLIACKISMILLVVVLPLPLFWWSLKRVITPRMAMIIGAGLLAAIVVGTFLGMPAAFDVPNVWWNGQKILSDSYAQVKPPHSSVSGNVAGLLFSYCLQTFGIPLLVMAGIGVYSLVKRSSRVNSALLIVPMVLYPAVFAAQMTFFERNLSPFVPLIGVFAACGMAELWSWMSGIVRRKQLGYAMIALLTVAVSYRGAALSARLVFKSMEVPTTIQIARQDEDVRLTHSGLPFVTVSFLPGQWEMPILQGRASYAGGFVVRGFEYNDDFTRANVEAAIQEFHLKLLRFVPSAFPEVPVSTLHTYHSPAIVYLFVPPTGS